MQIPSLPAPSINLPAAAAQLQPAGRVGDVIGGIRDRLSGLGGGRTDAQQGAELLTGTVDFYNADGGYGFIAAPKLSDDVFFHAEVIKGAFEPQALEGSKVAFRYDRKQHGPFATEVQLLPAAR